MASVRRNPCEPAAEYYRKTYSFLKRLMNDIRHLLQFLHAVQPAVDITYREITLRIAGNISI